MEPKRIHGPTLIKKFFKHKNILVTIKSGGPSSLDQGFYAVTIHPENESIIFHNNLLHEIQSFLLNNNKYGAVTPTKIMLNKKDFINYVQTGM